MIMEERLVRGMGTLVLFRSFKQNLLSAHHMLVIIALG